MDHTSDSPYVLIPVGPKEREIFAKVSPEDEELVRPFKWSVMQDIGYHRRIYASASVRGEKPRRKVVMHRLILDAPPNLVVDHINFDTLDNRRCNIRLTTRAGNRWNTMILPHASTPYRGVRRHKDGGFEAVFICNHNVTSLGVFADQIEAAMAWDEAARIHYGDMARLNFPKNGEMPTRYQ